MVVQCNENCMIVVVLNDQNSLIGKRINKNFQQRDNHLQFGSSRTVSLISIVMASSNRKGQFPLIELTIRWLRRIRFWNDTPGKPFPTIGSIIVVSYLLIWLIPSWLFTMTSQASVTSLIKAANEQIVFCSIFFKMCVFALKFRRWESLFYDLQRAYSSVMDDMNLDIQRILGHVEKSAYHLTKWYGYGINFNCCVYGSLPMLFVAIKYAATGSYDVPLSTPIESNYLIPGYRTNFWIWFPLDIALSFLLSLHGVALFSIECFSWNLVHATSCLFRVLQIQANELSNQNERNDEWADKFSRFVNLHDLVLRSAGTLEEILRTQMLFIYASTVFELCLVMTVLSLAFKDLYLLITMFCVIGHCLFQTFSFSYLGTELIEESESVADSIFHSTWYIQNVNRQKDLCFALMRAKKPVSLTAGKFFVVKRESFTQVIKQAYTIFTLMSQFLDDTVN
ncbi:odorant receptor 49b-like [Anopheles moucheti]|uniref:odorant receptor 49b-like n=1 Tax=Anopheles moucheti TaxID=186751 RepID=UPI0022F10F3B|nr:odorant receptor 49b-like [Anopheles moucheti]